MKEVMRIETILKITKIFFMKKTPNANRSYSCEAQSFSALSEAGWVYYAKLFSRLAS